MKKKGRARFAGMDSEGYTAEAIASARCRYVSGATFANARPFVGLLTFHYASNFGAVLQAYALSEILRRLGCRTEVIDFRGSGHVLKYRSYGRLPWNIWRKWLRNVRFDIFRSRFLPVGRRVYRNGADLKAAIPDYDCCVVGSDQVWNLQGNAGRENINVFFLSFVQERTRRVAYAPSLGDGRVSEAEQGPLGEKLKLFHALSAREPSGSRIISKLACREVPVVLDPSLLLDNYTAIEKPPDWSGRRYIVAYAVERSRPFCECVAAIRRKSGLPVVNIGYSHLDGADRNLTALGPRQWLGWMRYAEAVCTNSFHGTAFSLVLKRNFVFVRVQTRPLLNERIEVLLDTVGLRERIFDVPAAADLERARESPINYTKVFVALRERVLDSVAFLAEAVLWRGDEKLVSPSRSLGEVGWQRKQVR